MKADLPATSHCLATYLGLSLESLVFSLKGTPRDSQAQLCWYPVTPLLSFARQWRYIH